MPKSSNALTALAATLRHFARRPTQDETQLYFRRALRAASEERHDVAMVFCGKALENDPAHLPTRLLLAHIHDRVLRDYDAAVAAYRKVITLAGYDSTNPYCAAAQKALDALISKLAVGDQP